MINYKWVISAMDTAPSDDGLIDVVKVVHWRRQAAQVLDDKTYTGDTFGDMKCAPPDPMAFTPYDQLTFEEVCSWLETKLDVQELDSYLDAQIASKINPPIVQLPLPWNN